MNLLLTAAVLLLSLLVFDRAHAETPIEQIIYVDEEHFRSPPRILFGGDPFFRKPGSYQELPPQATLELQAVIYNEQSPSAIINKQVITKGQRLTEGPKVVDIGRNFVLIEERGRVRELKMSSAAGSNP